MAGKAFAVQRSAPSERTSAASTSKSIWFVVAGAALWGVDPLFRILLLKVLTSSQIVLFEHVLLLFYAVPVLWIHRAELRGLRTRHLFALLFIGWGGSAIATILFTTAFAYGNPNSVLLLQKLQPLFAILMARLVLREALPRLFPLLLIMALVGAYLLTFGWTVPISEWTDVLALSSLLSIGAAALWGGSTVMGRLLLDRMQFETITALRFTVALPLLIATTWIEGAGWQPPEHFPNWLALSGNLLLQAFVPGLLSLLLYYRGLANTKASYATLGELAFPAVGVLINWLVFHQPLSLAQLCGFAFIWIVFFYISRQR
ncbi:multidrug transporter [Gordoniibacillus kamchatkensis]|uniref:Multidrug transporter n=1 Tax=Gordoniibacillus kamchatkensis TaxID=1590651 RepID=A0ABR5AG85_9BACL|nr:DMT family transporter [Paenibacillus sp. VKM B-2647]KIL39723.1 multidrug transporter [Paenibacillus sp. VKM B-2647]